MKDKFSKLRHDKEFKELVESNVGYKLVSEYKNNSTKVKIYHEECDSIFEIRPSKFKFRGSRCPCTRKNKPKTHESFSKEVEEHMGKSFILKSKYTGIYDNIDVLHETCGNTFSTVARNLITKGKCPYCNSSKGETVVRDILTKYNINFIEQFREHDCKHIFTLLFDFYIPSLNTIIEYQGQQHYMWVESFQTKKVFEEGQIRDQIKRDYCKKNGIKMIEIPYWKKNVEDLLIDELGLTYSLNTSES